MTNERSLQVAQGLSILSLLIASGRLDPDEFRVAFSEGRLSHYLFSVVPDIEDDEDRARLLDAIEMVSP